MAKISSYPDGSPAQDSDKLVIARGADNFSLPVSAVRIGSQRLATLSADGSITVPAWATTAYVTAVAPGGGGGGCASSRQTAAGGGSSGMSVARKKVIVTPGGTITASCTNWNGGAGGVAGTSANGADGATLTLAGTAGVAESLVGGKGGKGTPDIQYEAGQGGASAGAGSQAGEAGWNNSNDRSRGGAGGGSPFGPGAPATAGLDSDHAGVDATFPGTGGSGAQSDNLGTAQPGGDGGPGLVVVEFAP